MSQAVVTTTFIDQTVNFTIEASDDFGVMDINIYTSGVFHLCTAAYRWSSVLICLRSN